MSVLETRKKTLGHINQTKKYLSAIIKELESRAKSHDNSALYSPEIDVLAKYTEGSSQDFIYDNCREYSDEITQVLNPKNKTKKKDIQKYITENQEQHGFSDEIKQIFLSTIKLIEK